MFINHVNGKSQILGFLQFGEDFDIIVEVGRLSCVAKRLIWEMSGKGKYE